MMRRHALKIRRNWRTKRLVSQSDRSRKKKSADVKQSTCKVRSRTVRRCRFGDGTFRRWRLQMCYAKNMCVFEILWRLDCKGCLLHKCFCCHPVGQCSFPTVRILEELSATVTTCGRKYGLWRLFLLAWGISEFTQKLSLDSIYYLIFHVGIILIAFHSKFKNMSYFLAMGAYRCTNMQ